LTKFVANEVMRQMEPGQAYWSLVETVWMPLNRSWDDGPEEFVRLFRSIPPEIGHLYAGHWCQSEVCNGGLRQFFCNSTGILAPEAVDGFEAIGLKALANVLSEAIKYFGETYPRGRDVRLQHLPRAFEVPREECDPFAEFDEQFDELLDEGLDGDDDSSRWERAADEYATKYRTELGAAGQQL
jgi:Domain of unknown function (DUF4375)